MEGICDCQLTPDQQACLDALSPQTVADETVALEWIAFRVDYANDLSDLVAMRAAGDSAVRIREMLGAIWPVIRENILTDLRRAEERSANNALLWMVSDRLDVAVMVVDGAGHVLRCNQSARQMLDESRGFKLRCEPGTKIDVVGMRELRDVIRRCAEGSLEEDETVVVLEGVISNRQVPVTVSRFPQGDGEEQLVLLMLPRPPDPKRVEFLASKMGLTRSEARVAALLQLGISNKAAARMAGLREQTFSTYAKRAMSKLNVSCRAEMAQMLTWQAHGGGTQ